MAAHSLSIGVLTMPGEHDDTLELVDALLAVRASGDAVYVHVNGGDHSPVSGPLHGLPDVVVSHSERNLGVAGGRNHLAAQASFADRDLALFLDNDLLLSSDALDRYRRAVDDLGGLDQVGLIGAPCYPYRRVRRRYRHLMRPAGGPLGTSARLLDGPAFIAENLAADRRVGPTNAGTNPDWDYAYLSALPLLRHGLEVRGAVTPPDGYRFHQGREDFWPRVAGGGYLESSNVPGGASAVALRALGGQPPYEPLFSPYGAEDVDLAIRLARSGRCNAIMLGAALPHGRHDRHGQRRSPGAELLETVNRNRTKHLLAARHARRPAAEVVLACEIGRLVREICHGRPVARRDLLAAFAGSRIAQRQLDDGAPPDWSLTARVHIDGLAAARFGTDPPAATSLRRVERLLRAVAAGGDVAEPDALNAEVDAIAAALAADADATVAALVLHQLSEPTPLALSP